VSFGHAHAVAGAHRARRNKRRRVNVATAMGALKRKKLKRSKRAERRASARAIAQDAHRRKAPKPSGH
jgi:hypothetical protein